MAILNLTQHNATPEQKEAGVFDLPSEQREELKLLLTVENLPSRAEIEERAVALSWLAHAVNHGRPLDGIMIGGAPFLMGPLEVALKKRGLNPLYAFSKRVAVEDGGVKTSVFKHLGFVEA